MHQFLAVLSDPVPGRESDYESWYNEHHLPEVLSTPGFEAARRYVAAGEDPITGKGFGAQYLTIYELSGDIDVALANLAERRARGELTPLPDSVSTETLLRVPFRAVAGWVRK